MIHLQERINGSGAHSAQMAELLVGMSLPNSHGSSQPQILAGAVNHHHGPAMLDYEAYGV